MFEIISILVALFILVAIAFPKLVQPTTRKSKKLVGSTYWGRYEGAASEESADSGRVQVPHPARQHRVVGGSETYARGPAGGSKK